MPRNLSLFLRRAMALLGLLATLFWATGRLAMADDMAQDAIGSLSITPIAGWRASPTRHVAGLEIALAPGWRTYWRSAGSTGIAPRLDWNKTRNAEDVSPVWPVPRIFRDPGGLALGFEEGLVLPLVVRTSPGSARLEGTLSLGVCAAVCVPVQVPIVLDLPDGGKPVAKLEGALEAGPRRIPLRATCTTRPTPSGLALTGIVELPPMGGHEAVVFEVEDPRLWVTDASVARDGNRLVASSELMAGGGGRVTLDRSTVRITIVGTSGAVELAGCTE